MQLRHPATVIAAAALFVALGAGATAYASGLIPGSRIKNHSIAAKKLTRKAIKSLHGKHGPAGPAGPAGPQGPGGSIVTYDSAASASPSVTTLGTFLGDTIGASCSIPTAGKAQLHVFLKTGDGSWKFDNSFVENDNGSTTENAGSVDAPAGTYETSIEVASFTASAGGSMASNQDVFVQLAPSPGSMIWHATASTLKSAQTCHLSVESFPETISAVTGTPAAATKSARVSSQLGGS